MSEADCMKEKNKIRAVRNTGNGLHESEKQNPCSQKCRKLTARKRKAKSVQSETLEMDCMKAKNKICAVRNT